MTSFVHNPPKSTAKYNVGGYTNGKNGSTGTDALVQIQDLKELIATGGTGGGGGGVTNAQLALALQSYVKTSGATMTGQLNTVTATATANAANKSYVDSTTVSLSGDTMTGTLNMSNNAVTNVRLPTNDDDVATKLYVDTKDAENDIEVQTKLSKYGDTCTGYLKMTLQPAASTDLCNKSYTDNAIATSTVFQPINSKLTTISAITPTANCVIGTDATGVILMTPTQTRAAIDVYSVPEVTSVLANYLPLTGGVMTGKISGIQTPTNPTDAVNKEYADMLTAGLVFYPGVACYTSLGAPAPLAFYTYDGNQTISIPWTAIPIDGYTLQLGDRVLVNTTVNHAANGVYVVTQLASPITLVRPTDLDGSPLGEFEQGGLFYVTNGTVYGGSLFVQTSPPPSVLGTSPIIYSQYAAAKNIAAGANIAITGNQIAVAPALTGITSLTGLSAPVNAADAANKSYVDAQDATNLVASKTYADNKFLPLAGGTMTGNFNMGQKNLLNASIVQILSTSKNSVINIQQQGGGTSYYINLPASAPVINASTPTNLVLGINNSTVCTWMNPETQVYKNLLIGSGYGNSTTDTVTLTKASGSAYALALPAAAPTASTYLKYDGTNYAWASAGSVLTAGSNLNISGNEIALKTTLTGITSISGLTNPVNAADAANKQYVDATDAANMTDINARFDAQDINLGFKLPLAGGTMSGPINMGTKALSFVSSLEFNVQGGNGDTLMLSKFPGTPYRISFPGAPPAPNTYLKYDGTNGNPIYSWSPVASTLTAGSNIDITSNVVSLPTSLTGITSITGLADPVNATDAVNKQYIVANYLSKLGGMMLGGIDMGGQIIYNTTSLALRGTSSSDALTLSKASGGAAYTLALPAAAPTASTYLKYDGTNYAWASAGSALTAFTGASSGANGTLGGVPAPQAGDQLKYLQGNGTWSAVSASGVVAANYMHVTNVQFQAVAGQPFEFVTIVSQSTNTTSIIHPNKTSFTLQAGNTYKCIASIGSCTTATAGIGPFGSWSTTTTGTAGYFGNGGAMDTSYYGWQAVGYISPTINTTIYFMISSVNVPPAYMNAASSWATIEVVSNNNAITAFTGATSALDGAIGYIPKPLTGQQNYVLTGAGSWQPASTPLAYSFISMYRGGTAATNSPDVPIVTAYPGGVNDGFPFDKYTTDSPLTNPYVVVNMTGSPAVTNTNFTLTLGRTYRLSACLSFFNVVTLGTIIQYAWIAKNGGTTAFISHPGGLGSGNTAVGQNDMERYVCECVYTPTVANTVVLFTNVASNAGSYAQTLIKSSTVLSFGQCAWAKIEVIA